MRRLVLIAGAVGAAALASTLGACGSSAVDAGSGSSVDIDAGGAKPDVGGGIVDAGTARGPTFNVGGVVTGLLGSGLVLQNNAGDDVPVAKDGSFTFPTRLDAGSAFKVTIKTQPSAPTQTCTVSGGTGTITNGNVTSVTVNCATDKFTVGGSISGLAGSGLVLQNNAGDDVIVNANGTFAFPSTLSSGADYAVTVKTQPSDPSQTCTVASGIGKIDAGDVSNVAITCVTNEYKVGGTVAGLVGSGLTLQLNGGQSLPISANGGFEFPTPMPSGTSYEVTISAQPGSPQQTCSVAGATGAIGAADVSSVLVNCATNAYAIGGSVTGLAGTGLVLRNNGGNDLTVSADGTFAFSAPVEAGQPYAITIASQPTTPWQSCTLSNASGTVASAAVTTIAVACTTNTYKVKGEVSGLAGSGLVLQNSAGDNLPIAADGSFEFALPVASGQTFNVTVKDQPSGPSQTCTVGNGTGTIGGADVTSVTVQCTTNSYTVGGTVSGLVGSGLVIQNNSGDQTPISADGSFTFDKPIPSGGTYDVTVVSPPTGPHQTCTVSAGSGTITNGNVVTVAVNCATNKYALAGTVSGLKGTALVLQNNGADITINNDGSWAFGAPLDSGSSYSVTVKTQPTVPSQTCVVASGAGTIGGSDTNIAVTCTTNKYKVGGTLSGLTSGTIVLQNGGTDGLSLTANGAFSFATSIDSGAAYAATIATPPGSHRCAITSGSGLVGSGDVTTIDVKCVPEKRVFISSALYTGNLGGLDGADAKCQTLANAANLGGTYRAWLSDSTGSPSTRFARSAIPYALVDGTVIANNWADLTDNDLAATISKTEKGGVPPNGYPTCSTTSVWTNTLPNGTPYHSTYNCGDWKTQDTGAVWGRWDFTSSGWSTYCLGGTCTWEEPIYCFEQ